MSKKGKRFSEKSHKNKTAKHFLKRKDKKALKILLFFLIIFFISLMIFSGIKIYEWIKENQKSAILYNKISNQVIIDSEKKDGDIDKYTINFEELTNINPDTIGWLKVNGVQIEYPVVISSDNKYYLTHSFDKTYNSAGWIFADYRNKIDGTDKNIIIYGHNRLDGSMFGNLTEVLTEEWYSNEENQKIIFFTEDEKNIYEVFSIYKIEKEDYYIQTSFENDETYKNFLNTIKNRSIVDFNIDITEKDQILTLSTCGTTNKYRVVVHAKKI